MASRGRLPDLLFGFLLGLFFVSSLILTVDVPDMYNSPDERAVATSIEAFIEEGIFTHDELLNLDLLGNLGPRSMVAVGAQLTPVSFPGILLVYGALGKIVGFPLTKLLTPLLAVLAILAWRKTLESFLSRRVAFIGAVLFMTLAGFWFYTARVFMHNVPFLCWIIFGCFFLAWRPFGRRASLVSDRPMDHPVVPLHTMDVACAGFMFGLALLFRTSEVVWMMLVGVVFLLVFRHAFRWKPFIVFLVALVMGIAPLFIWNHIHFQNPWQLGYTVSAPMFSSPDVDNHAPQSESLNNPQVSLSRALFPFGVHPRLVWKTFVDYQLELTWWMTILSVFGVGLIVGRRRDHSREGKILRTIILATFVAGGYLTFLYGSWKIADNPDPHAVTLANSYVRYWLPLYVVSTIPSALFIEWLAGKTKTLLRERIVIGIVLLAVSMLSMRLVFFDADDGLLRTREVLFESVAIRHEILSLTEPNSVIVVDRADKILFPARRVLVPLRSEETYQTLPGLVEMLPTYYYGITLPEEDLVHLNDDILMPRGLVAEPVTTIHIETLYRFRKRVE